VNDFNINNPSHFLFIFLPQEVHLIFSKNCNSPQRRLVQRIISPAPHLSHRSSTKVCCLQMGQVTVSGRPQPEQTFWPLNISRRHAGQRSPNGLPLPQAGQYRTSPSIIDPQWMQGVLYVAIFHLHKQLAKPP